MEWFWVELGIEPTENINDIKRAYVVQMRAYKKKSVSESASPEDYQRLDDAEQAAIAWVDQQKQEAAPVSQTSAPTAVTPVAVTPKATARPSKSKTQPISAKPPRNKAATPAFSPEFLAQVAALKKLFASHKEKVSLATWQGILGPSPQWRVAERHYLVEELASSLGASLTLLPKKVWLYLYDALGLAEEDVLRQGQWGKKIQALPAFDFAIAAHLPAGQQDLYFAQRYRFWELLQKEEWVKDQAEIEHLQRELALLPQLSGDKSIVDQDVLNLKGIYLCLQQLPALTVREPRWNLLDHFELTTTPVAKQKNKTTKFLQLVFTSFSTHQLTFAETLFIEEPANSYVEANLRELLLVLTFTSLRDDVKVQTHYGLMTHHYQALISPTSVKQAPQRVTARQTRHAPTDPAAKGELINKLGFLVLILAGIIFLGTLFSNSNSSVDDNYLDYEYEEEGSGDSWSYAAEIDLLPTNFKYLFGEPHFEEDLTFERQDFIAQFVAAELQPTFANYLEQWQEEDVPFDDFGAVLMARPADDKQQTSYLYRYLENNKAIFTVSAGKIISIVGPNWNQLSQTELDREAAAFVIQPEELQAQLLSNYYFIPQAEREFDKEALGYLMSASGQELSDYDRQVELPAELAQGTYALSLDRFGQSVMLFFTPTEELVMIFYLDEFGHLLNAEYAFYYEFAPEHVQGFMDYKETSFPITAKMKSEMTKGG